MKIQKVKTALTDTFKIWKATVLNIGDSNIIDLSGTTAYFAIFSIAPILIIIIAVFGFVIGDDAIRYKLFEELNVLIGQDSSKLLNEAIDNYQISDKKGIGTAVGIVLFLVSATTLFATIQNSINYIWRIKVKDNLKMNIIKLLKDRVLSFGVILSLGFVLLVSLVIDAVVAFLKDILTQFLTPDFVVLAQILNIALSLGIVAVVFTLIFRFLPDVKVRWNASWFAGFFTAFLFSLGKILIGLLIGNNSMGAVYGAVSAFIAILAWVYYASIIFYIGVELSRQYSLYYKHDNEPSNYAVPFRISVIKDDKI
ncbi:MAG: YihY/virulence factor BrkB family protein [Lentimicrobium sp.]|jgi:membrane protein|nr:YihY/virulence factor BrkB family protein [Lentimicrobium sp.]